MISRPLRKKGTGTFLHPFSDKKVPVPFFPYDTAVGVGCFASSDTSGAMDVMLVAAKKDIVEDYVSLIRLAGLNPVVMDVDAFALQNAFELSIEDMAGCYAIINVGAEELGINAVKDGVSIFTRDSWHLLILTYIMHIFNTIQIY